MQSGTQNSIALDFIKETYLSRKAKNSHYSVASFARDLGLSRPYLSRLLTGQRPLTLKLAVQVANLLNVSNEVTDEWLADILSRGPQGKRIPKSAQTRLQDKAEISQKYPIQEYEIAKFKVVSEWYHMAVINLTFLKAFKADPTWIANRLGISTFEADEALKRLMDLGLLERRKQTLVATNKMIFIDQKKTDLSVRKFHQAMSKKAIQALEDPSQQTFDDQYFSGVTLAFNRKKMPEIKAKLQSISKQLMRIAVSDDYQDVYHLNLQLFPITKKKKEK